jgi:hypothetical protein
MQGIALRADGSSSADTQDIIIVNRDDDADRWRYRCPNGHATFEPTNSHIWCKQCAEMDDAGEGPEYWEVRDMRTNERIPWSRIEFR